MFDLKKTLVLACATILLFISVFIKVSYYTHNTPKSGRAELQEASQQYLKHDGFRLIASHKLLINDKALWFEYQRDECQLRIAAMDPTGATVSVFRDLSMPDWSIIFVLNGRVQTDFPRFRAMASDLYSRAWQALGLKIGNPPPIAVATSGTCAAKEFDPSRL
jgi:hypothetical protein